MTTFAFMPTAAISGDACRKPARLLQNLFTGNQAHRNPAFKTD